MLKLESAHDAGSPVPLQRSVAIHNPELPYTTRNCSHATTLRAHTIENGATRAQSHARTDDSASRARDPGDPVGSLCEGLTQAFERACCHAQIQRSPALLILIPAWLSETPPPNRLCGNKLRPILVICTTALFLFLCSSLSRKRTITSWAWAGHIDHGAQRAARFPQEEHGGGLCKQQALCCSVCIDTAAKRRREQLYL